MQPTPYIFFNGNCADAIAFYASTLGAKVQMTMKAGDMPGMDIPADRADWIAHATLSIGNGHLMVSDSIFDKADPMAGAHVMLSYATEAEAKAAFDALSDGAEITMAYEPTFWSAGFGTLVDKFGVRWMIGTDEAPAEG